MFITHLSHELELLSEHAVFLPQHSALVLSDVHLGKAATFQAHGLPVPEGDDATDLQRISDLLEKTKAENLVIAGDLLHSPRGVSAQLVSQLESWMARCSANITLVLGNHDQRSLRAHHLESVPFLDLDDLRIIHDPADAIVEKFSICGHLHPVIRIRDDSRHNLRSPCFWLSQEKLILPAFGSFTGGQKVKPTAMDKIYLPSKERVVELPRSYWK